MPEENNFEIENSPAREAKAPNQAGSPSPEPDLAAAPSGGSSKGLSGSIVIAALLICGSVFYNANLILKKLDALRAQNPASGVLGAATAAALPDVPLKVADRKDQPVIGQPQAGLAIYEFSDFQCPFCTQFFKETYPKIKSQYLDTGKAKLIYRHFPLPFHQNAEPAAEAAECANRQGQFESYFNLLFSNSNADGKGLEVADLKRYASQLGLDLAAFNKCLDNNETASVVKADTAEGTALGVDGTPTFVIAGKKIVGAQPFASFAQAIDEALKP